MNDTIFGLPRVLACPIFSCKAKKHNTSSVAKHRTCRRAWCLLTTRETTTTGYTRAPQLSQLNVRDYYWLNSSNLGPLAIKLNRNSKTMQSPCATLLLWCHNWCAGKHEKQMLMKWKWSPTSSTQAKAFYHYFIHKKFPSSPVDTYHLFIMQGTRGPFLGPIRFTLIALALTNYTQLWAFCQLKRVSVSGLSSAINFLSFALV